MPRLAGHLGERTAVIDSDVALDTVEALAEEFIERHRRGESPAVAEYIEKFPGLADRIRSFFPALLQVERLKPAPGAASGFRPGIAGSGPERLGDYRILREVGRGGMGVVYEAEQESLGRRVALKVLAAPDLQDPKRVLRFHREARAAARLHHTNIVPVFGVGESRGVHYYIMQLIPGLGLDAVSKEVRRLRGLGPRSGADPAGRPGVATILSATDVARALTSGRFPSVPSHDAPTGDVVPGAGPRACSSTAVLPGQTEPSSAADSAGRYARSVALIGVQVAEALEYAHRQGVLHRDIKPSNLLLDGRGIVWVTDFGLAKAADSADLTHTGDIVGTVRYMAPERFEGQCDARSDVYALGLTLYELLARRPAFDEPDRARLIRLVTKTDPPRLRDLDPSVPRDLETVVHKAIERDPAHRYPSAGDLAEDLRRFLDDRPIRARRLSLAEHAWRWCRRNPAAAALVAAVLALLVLSAGWGLWVQRQRGEAARRKGRAREAVAVMMAQAAGLLRQGLWAEARAVLKQVEGRLDDADARDLRARLALAESEVDLSATLEANRMGSGGRSWRGGDSRKVCKDYATAFERSGLLSSGDEGVAAARIARSAIRGELVAALDDWAVVTPDDRLRARLLRLTRRVDPDPAWRDLVRDPSVRGDRRALESLAAEVLGAPGVEQPPHLLHTLAVWLYRAGGNPVPLLRAAQQRRPWDFWLNYTLACALLVGNPEESVGFFRAALVARPQNHWIYHILAETLYLQGKKGEAIAALRKATELDPKSAASFCNLGLILNQLGRTDEAIAALRKATELDPGDTRAFWGLGVVGRPREAIPTLRKAVELDPGNALARRELAEMLAAAGRDPGQCNSHRRAIAVLTETAPDDHDAWNYGAVLWAQTGDLAGARRHCRRMLDRFGRATDPVIAERTAKACLLLPLGAPEQEAACDLADRAVAMSQDHWVQPWAEVTKALADYRRGRFAEAVARAGGCLPRGRAPWNREIPAYLVRAMTLSRLGRRDDARADLAVAADIYRTRAAHPGSLAPGGDWHDRVICEVLRREAEALLADTTRPVDE
jgi:serine/threonine protein kinase/Flp pilus assembly protein TadD